jgi:general secretion pathway protein K
MRSRARATNFRRGQRGVALITAVLIVALATILAINVTYRGMLDQRRSGSLFAFDQGFEVALGAEAWAAEILKKDAQESGQEDTLAEAWAQAMPPLPIDDNVGTIEGRLEDMEGRFNLNSLVTATGPNEPAVHQLERLLQIIGLEPDWAAKIGDWIDEDSEPGFPNGAEDSVYMGEDPAHLAANMRITRTSEMLALPNFGIERYRKIAPFIAALPVDAKINPCVASGEVIDSMLKEVNFSLIKPQDLADRRKKEGCFPHKNDLLNSLADSAYGESLLESSKYFRATIWVTIGTTQFTMYSLLSRGGQGGVVRPVLRSFGAE